VTKKETFFAKRQGPDVRARDLEGTQETKLLLKRTLGRVAKTKQGKKMSFNA